MGRAACKPRDYLNYCDLLFTIIETNSRRRAPRRVQAALLRRPDQLIARFAGNLGCDAAHASKLLNAVYYHAVGINGWCQENPLVDEAVKLAGITRRTVDFREEMRDFIGMCLAHYAAGA